VPDGTGFEAINWLRKEKSVTSPIIITSWYNDVDNKIFWLHVWADDYMTKPFEPDELVARIKALIRRSFHLSPSHEIHYKWFTYSIEYKKLTHEWKEIELTKKEQDIIEYFFVNQWKVVSKNVLVSTIWWSCDIAWVSDNTINVTISRLRKKLWDSFQLATVVGTWYSLKV
jgi:two-component system phosphate regulon response regulator PhoB